MWTTTATVGTYGSKRDAFHPERDLPQSINLHTHGLIVSPAGNGDNLLLSIPPGRSNRFDIKIPETQHHGFVLVSPAHSWFDRRSGLRRTGGADRHRTRQR
jgi:hypothetical protein